MKYTLEILPAAVKAMRGMPATTRRRIDRHIVGLCANPRPSGSLKLTGYPNAYRVRVGDYRIVEVGIVAHRREAYRDL